MIHVKLIADSLNVATGDRLTSFLLSYPRMIHAEVMTHRVFSRNAASSRAIPMHKFRCDVKSNPVLPGHWGANQKGMQAEAQLKGGQLARAKKLWTEAMQSALHIHETFEQIGLHKQVANRILEPWFHIQLLVSATDFGNYFALRCHKAANPDIQDLADAMLYAYMTHKPESKYPGMWHLVFAEQELPSQASTAEKLKICTARAARIAYKNFDGIIDFQSDIDLHDKLVQAGHWSPFEHCAMAMEPHAEDLWSGNFRGWKQYRKTFEGENRHPDLKLLWEERQAVSAYARGEIGQA